MMQPHHSWSRWSWCTVCERAPASLSCKLEELCWLFSNRSRVSWLCRTVGLTVLYRDNGWFQSAAGHVAILWTPSQRIEEILPTEPSAPIVIENKLCVLNVLQMYVDFWFIPDIPVSLLWWCSDRLFVNSIQRHLSVNWIVQLKTTLIETTYFYFI